MLQYSVQPPFSSSTLDNSDYFRSNNDRLTHRRDPFSPRSAIPNSPPPTSTNLSSSPTLSSISSKLPRSPYISARQLSSPVDLPSARIQSAPKSRPPSQASAIDDVLFPGDVVGEGKLLQNEPIRLVSLASDPPRLPEDDEPASEFEVIRRLGAGSYAVVYLVREVLYRAPPSSDGHITVGQMDLEDRPKLNNVYGREFAIKCLSKANLDEDALAAQMSEVTIHQSLRPHANIVTHHRTLETSSFLLLLLEYVPGEDLFYFLEQARDHYEIDSTLSESSSTTSLARTPPTPSLLSNLNPSQLLSRTRLRLISSMFSQMCDAVADCHAQNVYHRDIKPENFIVTDGWTEEDDGHRERKVVVKLTDFGLSTTDVESSDMDCGSAPYMSYECRNNIAPTYRPRAADVWSLGIVLINMLYHYNPWTDTAVGACGSFDLYRQHPVNFFMQRFAGMTRPVAELLAHRVFNILDGHSDDSKRITASQFGIWARDLPDLLSEQPGPVQPSHKRVVSVSSTTGHPLASSIPVSHRPTSRPASRAMQTRPASRTHSRAPSLGPAFERPEAPELSTVIDQDLEEEQDVEEQEILLEGMTSRSTSTTKRRKRGARKGKGAIAASPTTPKDETLDTLAFASQTLAREISRASKASSKKSTSTTESARARRAAFEPVAMYAMPTAMFTNGGLGTTPPPVPALPATAQPPAPVTKKPSKWKLSFGKASAANVNAAMKDQTVQSAPPTTVDVGTSTMSQTSLVQHPMSATASNVTTLIMGLSPPPPVPSLPPAITETNSSTWGRGRRTRESNNPAAASKRAPSAGQLSPHASVERFDKSSLEPDHRGISPHSSRSGRPLASSASSMASSNWRNSTSTMSSAGTSTSAFTHYSNSSMRSVSSAATSVSATSWRSKQGGAQPHSPNSSTPYRPPGMPKNIKVLDGVPWELANRMQPHDSGDVFGQPPPRKPRPRKPQDLKLDTITERPLASASTKKSPTGQRLDASTSTTDLDSPDGDWQNKKVQKGQINALAKMLSALRR